jgi:hypothetical protein
VRVVAQLKRWWLSRAAKHRKRLRAIDAEILWPAMWEHSGRDPAKFVMASTWHMTIDPVWQDDLNAIYENEDSHPVRWMKRQLAKAGGAP